LTPNRPARALAWLFVSQGALAGACLALPDVVFTWRLGASLASAWALLGFWLWGGALLGAALLPPLAAGTWVRSKVPDTSLRLWFDAAVAFLIAIPVADLLFAGDGIKRTLVGGAGPWVVPALTLGGVRFVVAPLVRRSREVSVRVRASAGALLLVVASGGVFVERTVHPGTYLALHAVLIVALLVVLAAALYLVRVPKQARLVAAVVSVATLPWLVAFPATISDRELLAETGLAAGRIVAIAQSSLDLDGDGRSPVFGGGDCADTDPRTYVGAPEQPRDGRDTNCDGLDDPRVTRRSYAPFRIDEERARQIRDSASKLPTIVVIIDSLRGDRVRAPTQPNLSRLADESIVFRRAYASASSTKISVPTLLTGRVGATSRDETIGERLAKGGRSSVFSAATVVRDTLQNDGDHLRGFSSIHLVPVPKLLAAWGGGVNVSTDERVTAGALAQLRQPQPPALTWIHYFDLHQWNELADDSLPRRGDFSRYDAVLARMDATLTPLLALRDQFNLVVLADHGEALGVKGHPHHTRFLFREMAHVPLMIRVPGVAPSVVETPVGLAALFDTLLDLQGLPTRSERGTGSLLGLVGMQNPGDGPGFVAFESREWALNHGPYRLLYAPDSQITRLYDIVRDFQETRNLAPQQPDLAADLLDRLFVLRNAMP
jgi:hypothetical protein